MTTRNSTPTQQPTNPIPEELINLVEREIQNTDNQIDRLVYQLYNLTKEEIKIVEDATA